MRDEFWLEDQSPDLFDVEDDQTPDTFGAFGGVLVGPEGPAGKSAYQVAVDNGFIGTEEEWLASLVGPPGADGTVSFDELTPAQKESLRGEGVPAGGTTGQVLAKSSNTDYATRWVDAGGNARLTILSYGHSTWADFIAAYNSKSIVYCQASSGSDPASGSQTRMAFMAYVNSAASPTSVEFQYYRSVSSHSDAQQGDQVFIYKLTSAGAWSVTVREAYTKIAAGTNMTSSYANGTLTLNATGGGGTSDYDDLTDKPSINNVTLSGNKTAADLGLGTYTKPSDGIPASDLASAVLSPYRTAAAQDAIDATEVIVVNIASYSGSQVRVPASGTNSAITADHVLLYSSIGTPANQTGDWTVTTYDGYLTLSGSASAATTVKLVLGKAGTTI